MLVFLLSSCCPQQKLELEREIECERRGVWERVCVFNTSFGIVRRHAWLPLLRFYCFLALSLLWQHLGIMWAERPWLKTLLSHPPPTPPDTWLWEKSRRVLRVLWPAKCWPAWKAQCPWGSLISLFPFSQWLCLYPSTAAQLTTERKRKRERERMKGGERHGANYTHVTESESI